MDLLHPMFITLAKVTDIAVDEVSIHEQGEESKPESSPVSSLTELRWPINEITENKLDAHQRQEEANEY